MAAQESPPGVTEETQTLAQITQDLHDLETAFDSTDDPESLEIILAAFLTSDLARLDKLDKYAGVIGQLKARVAFRKAEAERIRDLARVDTNKLESMIHRLKEYFLAEGINQPQHTAHYRIALVHNGGAAPVRIIDEHLVPNEYWMCEIHGVAVTHLDRILGEILALVAGPMTPIGAVCPEQAEEIRDRTEALLSCIRGIRGTRILHEAIRSEIEAGGTVNGATIGERGQSIRIK
jgi:hypothetical protein